MNQLSVKERIKLFLDSNKISINRMSKLIDIPQKTLNNQINGEISLGLNVVLAISDYYDIDLIWLLTGEDNKEDKKRDDEAVQQLMKEKDETIRKQQETINKLTDLLYERKGVGVVAGGAGAEIKKNLTTHVARHTYATYLLNNDIPISTVSRALGHSNLRMTEHYARLLAKTIVSDMEVLLK